MKSDHAFISSPLFSTHEGKTEKMLAIRKHLDEIEAAGKATAIEQYPVYVEKAEDLRRQYQHILQEATKTDEEKKEEEERINTIQSKIEEGAGQSALKDRLRQILRDRKNAKHVLRMSKRDRQAEIDMGMTTLFYGLEPIPVPEAFGHLVATGNPTLDAVNRYNILLAMQRHLVEEHPEKFGR